MVGGLWGSLQSYIQNYNILQSNHTLQQTVIAIVSGKGKFRPEPYPPFTEIYPDVIKAFGGDSSGGLKPDKADKTEIMLDDLFKNADVPEGWLE